MPFCELSTGLFFALGVTGLLTMLGALLGVAFSKGKSYSTQVFLIFATSAGFFVIALILAPYISTIFTCSCNIK